MYVVQDDVVDTVIGPPDYIEQVLNEGQQNTREARTPLTRHAKPMRSISQIMYQVRSGCHQWNPCRRSTGRRDDYCANHLPVAPPNGPLPETACMAGVMRLELRNLSGPKSV